jgi:hypothetical protein
MLTKSTFGIEMIPSSVVMCIGALWGIIIKPIVILTICVSRNRQVNDLTIEEILQRMAAMPSGILPSKSGWPVVPQV